MNKLSRKPNAVANQRFDIVIVGGGISGAGIARHATQIGLKTLLVEANDFSAGTSSRSTKLIHGGLRYLAMGDIALVRESALERKSVYQMAPHLAEPDWMVVPARSRAEMLKLRTGIAMYEKLGAVVPADKHQNWDKDRLREEIPMLNTDQFARACVYREYLTDDARLVIATLRAAAGLGAGVLNYMRVTSIEQSNQGCVVSLVDELEGDQLEVHSKLVINATGPWVESLLPPIAESSGQSRLQLSKGVHVVLPVDKFPLKHMMILEASDKRTLFAIPRGRNTYLGTTDTVHDQGPQIWPEVSHADVSYLLGALPKYFPSLKLTHQDIAAAWAGLRPLVNEPGKTPKEMSRKDEIWIHGKLITIAGGKLTGFRKMAEQVMDAVGELLVVNTRMPQPLAALPGGDIEDVAALVSATSAKYQLEAVVAERLVRLYGAEVNEVLGDEPTLIAPSVYREEVLWGLRCEGARCLVDVVYRRLRLAWFRTEELADVLGQIADIMATELGWDEARREQELKRCRDQLSHDLGFQTGSSLISA